MDPQTFKKTYKEVIRKYDSHDYTGLDANDLYVIERYKKIKNTPKYQAIPEPKVSKAFKKEVDGLSLKELKQAFPYLWHPVPGNQLSIEGYFQSETERQKELYVINRYYELLAKEPVSERSSTFMQDYVAYVNQTGLNPFTGKKASDDVMFMAKHYHTVQAVSALGLTLTGGYMDYVGLKSGVSAAAVSDDVEEINSQLTSSKKTVPEVGVSSDKTASSVEAILKQNGTTSKSFLNLTDADSVLSPKQTGIVRDVRVQIGLPESGTKMAKVIPAKYVEGIVAPDSKRNTVSGFVSVDSHSASLTTLDEVFEDNRLDYQNTPYSLGADDTYAKINFTLDSKMRLDIPLREPKVGEYPFTGRGFTGSKEIVLPEYELRKGANYHYQHGDTIGVYDSKSGNLLKQYMYDAKQKQWLLQ